MQFRQQKLNTRGTVRIGKHMGLVAYLFISPFLILHIFVTVYPTIYSFILSFFQYRGYGKAKFVGFSNYLRLLQYDVTWRELGNTVFYFVLHFFPCLILAFLLAYAIRSPRLKRYSHIYKPLIYLPQMCPSVATALVFSVIFGSKVGVINQLLGTEILFLNDMNIMRWPVIAMLIWRNMGWFFLILLAGMTTVSGDLTDAASIDGATTVQTIFHVYIPIMKPIFSFLTITQVISSLKLYSEPNILIARGTMAPYAAAPITNLVLSNLQGASFGMASAAGWILFVIILLCTFGVIALFREE